MSLRRLTTSRGQPGRQCRGSRAIALLLRSVPETRSTGYGTDTAPVSHGEPAGWMVVHAPKNAVGTPGATLCLPTNPACGRAPTLAYMLGRKNHKERKLADAIVGPLY